MDNQPELKIDEEFRALIPPLTNEEYRELEESIIKDGLHEPLSVWYTTIIDGYNRYEICRKHHIPIKTRRVYLKNREEVTIWICTNQLARRNITDSVRKYLIGKRYESEKILGAHNAAGTNQYKEKAEKVVRSQNETGPVYEPGVTRTRERLGREYHLTPATITRYGAYTGALDRLKSLTPDLAEKILAGTLKMSADSVIALSQRPDAEIRDFRDKIFERNTSFLPYAVSRELIPKHVEKTKIRLPEDAGAIKVMPKFDPDAGINSLSLTIPSWVRSMERVLDEKIKDTSAEAKSSLTAELQRLLRTVSRLLNSLKDNSKDE